MLGLVMISFSSYEISTSCWWSRDLHLVPPSPQDWLEYPIFHEVQRKLGVPKLLEARAGLRYLTGCLVAPGALTPKGADIGHELANPLVGQHLRKR